MDFDNTYITIQIEAIAFYHFLVHQNVITKEQVDALFKENDVPWLHVKVEDYVSFLLSTGGINTEKWGVGVFNQILGLADFTGELMRYAIQVVSAGNYDQAMLICKVLRKMDTGKGET